jgi:lipopolysaccharide export system protein LptA
MKKYIFLLLYITLLHSIQSVIAQGNKIEVINANTFEIEMRGKSKVKKLIGDVKLKQDETILSCDSAYLFDETNFVEAYQNVNINHKDSLNFYGDILKYDGRKKLARLEKNVRMIDANSVLTTQELEFDLSKNKASYFSGGVLVSGQNELTSRYGYYYTTTKELYFKKDVKLVSPDFVMTTDTLKYHANTKLATFYSNTKIVSKEDTIYCEAGTYHTEKQTGVLLKRAKIRSAENTLIADTIIYDRKSKYAKALGDVVIIDTVNKTIILGDVSEMFGKEGRSYITSSPLVISIVDKDSMMIWADTIFTYQKRAKQPKDMLKAYRNVKIYKTDMQVICDSLVYLKTDSLMTLYHNPVLWSDMNQVTGDTILFYLNNRKLDSMDIRNNGFVISKETSRHYNQVKGRNMTAYFKEGKISFIQVYGNGQSIYFAKEDSSYIGVNVIDCSEMAFAFELGKIKTAKFITQPDANFYPLAELTPEELRLKGFVWRNKQKPTKQNLKTRKLYEKGFDL